MPDETPKPDWRDVALQLTLAQRRRLFGLECDLKVNGWDAEEIRALLWQSAEQWAGQAREDVTE
ncbi:MAG: hypothetical protein ACLP9Y_22085 [Mycobacterium sp.]